MFDWENGIWRRHPDSILPEQRIIIAGDWAPIWGYEDIVCSDPVAVYGDLLAPLQRADLRVVNIEASLSDRGDPIVKDGPNLQGPAAAAAALSCVPFDVGCLANNHMMDYGPQAMDDTRALLSEHGILTVGAGASRGEALQPLVIEVGETRIGLINFCEGEDGTAAIDGPGVFGWEIDAVVSTVQKLRPCVDLVLVIAHAGREYTPAPPPYVQRAFHKIAEAGADVIVGHHPHVPQGVEIYGDVPIAYSLGNFVFYQNTETVFRRRGYLLELELRGATLSGLNLIPYALERNGLRCLLGEDKTQFLQHIQTVSKVLASADSVAALWHAFIDSRGELFWREECGGIAALAAAAGDDRAAAAALRNRFITPAHRHFSADGLSRLIGDDIGSAPSWAAELVELWSR